MRRRLLIQSALCLLWLAAATGNANANGLDWPQYRGPESNGASAARQVFPTDGFRLEVAWQQPIGVGYSEVSVAEGRAVTMFAAGEQDVVAAFDVTTGDELWRHVIGETYIGHTGSDGGPISTPAIADGSVYGFGPHGDLFAVSLKTGKALWQRRLTETESRQPYYGFTSSPLVVGDLLVVQVGGGDGHNITAFDRATGEARWSAGDDSVDYESPILTALAGRRQIVAASQERLLGLDPSTGRELWRADHGLGGVMGTPTPVGDDGLLLAGNDEVMVLDVRQVDNTTQVTERWRSNEFKRSFAVPVVREGYAYGMSRKFLTCINVRDGQVAWRSRPPGGNVLILVDGHLALVGSDGELAVVKASPKGYEEMARVDVFEGDSFSAPSFAANRFFLRDVSSFASVRVVQDKTAQSNANADADPDRYLGPFGAALQKIAGLPVVERQAGVDALLQGRDSGPIVEAVDEIGFAHLIYRGTAQDVGISGNLPGFGWNDNKPLHHLDGTDLFFLSFQADPTGIWQYQLNIDFGEKVADPGNPRHVKIRDAEWSVLSLPNAPAKRHLDALPADTPRGRTETFTLTSQHLDNEREITVYLPPGYKATSEPGYPLLIHTWDNLRKLMHIEQALDHFIAEGDIHPPVVAFVPRVSGREHGELADAYVAMLVEELLPQLESRYRLTKDRQQRAIAGAVSSAGVAVYAGLEASDQFGRVAVQSFTAPSLDALFEPRDASDLTVYIELRTDEVERAPAATAKILEVLRTGGAKVELVEVVGGVGPAGWRTTLDQVLFALFGK